MILVVITIIIIIAINIIIISSWEERGATSTVGACVRIFAVRRVCVHAILGPMMFEYAYLSRALASPPLCRPAARRSESRYRGSCARALRCI